MTQDRSRRAPNTVAVRAPVAQTLRHELDCFDACARSDDTDYAAHGRQSSATPGPRNVRRAAANAAHGCRQRTARALSTHRTGAVNAPLAAGNVPGACLSISREPRWQGEGADARRAAPPVVVPRASRATPQTPLSLPTLRDRADFPSCGVVASLLGIIPNCVGSAIPFGEICRGRGHVKYSDRLLAIGRRFV